MKGWTASAVHREGKNCLLQASLTRQYLSFSMTVNSNIVTWYHMQKWAFPWLLWETVIYYDIKELLKMPYGAYRNRLKPIGKGMRLYWWRKWAIFFCFHLSNLPLYSGTAEEGGAIQWALQGLEWQFAGYEARNHAPQGRCEFFLLWKAHQRDRGSGLEDGKIAQIFLSAALSDGYGRPGFLKW